MELTYRIENGMRIPDLTLPPQPEGEIGKYGRMRLEFLKAHRRGTYGVMKANATLKQYLLEIDRTATETVEKLTRELARNAGVTEQMKNEDPLRWIGLMNSCKMAAEETVLHDLIHV